MTRPSAFSKDQARHHALRRHSCHQDQPWLAHSQFLYVHGLHAYWIPRRYQPNRLRRGSPITWNDGRLLLAVSNPSGWMCLFADHSGCWNPYALSHVVFDLQDSKFVPTCARFSSQFFLKHGRSGNQTLPRHISLPRESRLCWARFTMDEVDGGLTWTVTSSFSLVQSNLDDVGDAKQNPS